MLLIFNPNKEKSKQQIIIILNSYRNQTAIVKQENEYEISETGNSINMKQHKP